MDTLNTYVQGNYVKKIVLFCAKISADLKDGIKKNKNVGSGADVTYRKAERDKYDTCNPPKR